MRRLIVCAPCSNCVSNMTTSELDLCVVTHSPPHGIRLQQKMSTGNGTEGEETEEIYETRVKRPCEDRTQIEIAMQ